MKQLVIKMDDDLHYKFKCYALEKKLTMTDILTEYIKEILSRQNRDKELMMSIGKITR